MWLTGHWYPLLATYNTFYLMRVKSCKGSPLYSMSPPWEKNTRTKINTTTLQKGRHVSSKTSKRLKLIFARGNYFQRRFLGQQCWNYVKTIRNNVSIMLQSWNALKIIVANRKCPGARFSRDPETFRARKAIFSSTVPKDGEVYTPETSCM